MKTHSYTDAEKDIARRLGICLDLTPEDVLRLHNETLLNLMEKFLVSGTASRDSGLIPEGAGLLAIGHDIKVLVLKRLER